MSTAIPMLTDAPDHVMEDFHRHAILQEIPAGTMISHEGDACHHYPVVKNGIIRVFKLSREGHEVTLYRIREGESCVLTLTCLLKTASFPANAVVEVDSLVWLVPAPVFRDWTDRQPFWRDYIISYLSRTLNRVIDLMDDMLFRRVELRIIDSLLEQTTVDQPVLARTHQELANEVGTAREVVSRNLKELERLGHIRLARGEIRVLDRPALGRRSEIL